MRDLKIFRKKKNPGEKIEYTRQYKGIFVVTRQCARPFTATFVFGATADYVVYPQTESVDCAEKW